MPEGHTTHRLARDLKKDLGGQTLTASSPQGRVADLAASVSGSVLAKAEAYGKHMALHCAPVNRSPVSSAHSAAIIHIHLGLIGKFTRVPADTPTRDTIRLRLGTQEFTDTTADAVWDLTGPQTCELIDEAEWDQVTERLGPDPLRRGAGVGGKSCAVFCENLLASKAPLAEVLLDQSAVAGVGNVFRSELSFLLGTDPRRSANSLSESQAVELWQTIVEQLRRGVQLNRIVTLTAKDAQAGAGTTPGRLERGEALYVYKRQSEPCRRCGTEIQTGSLAGRKIWWCGRCQV